MEDRQEWERWTLESPRHCRCSLCPDLECLGQINDASPTDCEMNHKFIEWGGIRPRHLQLGFVEPTLAARISVDHHASHCMLNDCLEPIDTP